MRMLFIGHMGNIQKADDEIVHVSTTRSREMASAFSEVGYSVDAAVYWPTAERQFSDTLRYLHIDKIEADDYDIVFHHLILSIQQINDLAHGVPITRSRKHCYGESAQRFKRILAHPRKYLQLDAPRALSKDKRVDIRLVNGFKCIGVATENAVPKWKKMYSKSNVKWVNAATMAGRYEKRASPYPSHEKPNIIYLGRMNDASGVSPIEKLHCIANRLPDMNFHLVTNKVRDLKENKTHAINELQEGPYREIRLHRVQKMIRASNIILHRGSKYIDSFDWLHHANCAIGFAVRPDQDVASCKSWEYFGSGVPTVVEEGTPEAWVLKGEGSGEVAEHANWEDFADKIQRIIDNPNKYKRRKMRKYIKENHSYHNRAQQWKAIMEKYS